jgi:hypothetical protein
MSRSDPRRPGRLPAHARAVAALAAAAAVVAGCGPGAVDQAVTTPTTPTTPARAAAPASLNGEQARAAAAVQTLARALHDGDIEALCRPGAIFTPAVVADMNAGDTSCEATDEVLRIVQQPPALTVVAVALRPDLATVRVAVNGQTVPLDLVRSGRRWLVSFSDGDDPLGALAR